MKNSDRNIYLLTQSFGYYLRTETIKVDSTTKTLLNWYASPQLYIVAEFPDLKNLALPTLAMAYDRKGGNETFFMGTKYVSREHIYNIWGFSGGETSDVKNKIQREKLISDVCALLDDAEFVVYDWSEVGVKGSATGSARVKSYTYSKLARTGTSLADRYRFLFTVTLSTVEEID
jgi:hypothetical protein